MIRKKVEILIAQENKRLLLMTALSHQIMCTIFFNTFIYFIYLFLPALGLHCCAWAFSSCGKQGLLLVVVRGLLIAVVSLVVEHGL